MQIIYLFPPMFTHTYAIRSSLLPLSLYKLFTTGVAHLLHLYINYCSFLTVYTLLKQAGMSDVAYAHRRVK